MFADQRLMRTEIQSIAFSAPAVVFCNIQVILNIKYQTRVRVDHESLKTVFPIFGPMLAGFYYTSATPLDSFQITQPDRELL